MTRDETKRLLAIIKAAYPNFHKDAYGASKTDDEWRAVIDIWAIAMSDYPYGFITNGFKRLVQNNKFPPSPAEVIEAAKSSALDWCDVSGCLQYGGTISPDAWLYVHKRPMQFSQYEAEQKQLHSRLAPQLEAAHTTED